MNKQGLGSRYGGYFRKRSLRLEFDVETWYPPASRAAGCPEFSKRGRRSRRTTSIFAARSHRPTSSLHAASIPPTISI